MMRHCLDLQSGSVLHYPISGGWAENRFYLDAMQACWKVWQFSKIKKSNWGTPEFDFYLLLTDG